MFSNRSRVLLVSEGEIAQMSAQSYSEIKAADKIITNNSQFAMVKRVGERVAQAANNTLLEAKNTDLLNTFKWEFVLIDSPNVVNAFCMPGGKIAVYTGILPLTKTDDDLAVVMSHEVSHALAQHGNERMSQQLLVGIGSSVLNKVIENNSPEVKDAYNTIYGVGTTFGVMLPYSRLHETEADKIGLILMAKAGYNPQAATGFWERMSKLGQSKPPEFLSTHPSDETRIKDIKAYIPEAMKYYSK